VNSEKIDDVAVHRGDEVRWVNKRRAPVRVVLIDPELDKRVSCSNHFGGFMKPRDTAELMTNQSASICFNEEGLFKYVVRMDSTRETGEINVPGTIKVGEQGG
jgi:plastocyanin